MRHRLLPVLLLLSSCVRNPIPPLAPREDPSIRFPKFYERLPVGTDEQGEMYEVDGVVLQAITTAINDFIPPETPDTPCWKRRAAHRYRFIRQGNIVFVRIDANLRACPSGFGMLDYGAQYAISTDGRILRRLFDGGPGDTSSPPAPDAGELNPADLVEPSLVGSTTLGGGVTVPLPQERLDGGTGPMPQAPPAPPAEDGGSSPTH